MEEIFAILLAPIICLIVFGVHALNKLLEHKQIMAAIEKGTPLSDLRPAKPTGSLWIKNLTAGIMLLIIGIGLACILLVRCMNETFGGLNIERSTGFFIAAILFAIGISRIIHGLLLRKAHRQIQSSDQINARKNHRHTQAEQQKRGQI